MAAMPVPACARYRDQRVPSDGLTAGLAAVVTDVVRGGRPLAGHGFASAGTPRAG